MKPEIFPTLAPAVQIEGDGDLARVCDDVEQRLSGLGDANVYARAGMLVRVIEDGTARAGIKRDPSAPRIVPYDELALADLITRRLEIYRRNRKTMELQRVDCPRIVAQTLLARREWEFAPLEGVVEHPIMLADGQVLWQSGYHAETGLLLQLPLHAFQAPYETPSREDADKALELLRELISGFDFSEPLDESVALAYLLTPFVRPILPTAPAFAFDAHTAGSGKSTLVRTGSIIATGRDPAFIVLQADDPHEMRKLLFAAFLEGDSQIAIDNVDGPVGGADLAVILTSPVYRGRVLGQSVNASVPTRATISLNGNNLQIVGDLTRRVLVSRLDPMSDRPAEREFEFDPIAEAREARSDYVLAVLTILSAYVCSGARVAVRPFGSFEEWSRLVREPLVWLGLPDPVDSLRVLEEADPERTQLRSMLMAVHGAVASRQFKVAELLQSARVKHQAGWIDEDSPIEAGRQALEEALQAVCERNGELNARALGKWLRRMNGRIEQGLRFVQVRQTSVAVIWRVESVE